jgi:hypothetical protein
LREAHVNLLQVQEEGLIETCLGRWSGGYEDRRGKEGVADLKKATDPVGMGSSREEPAVAGKAADATAGSAEPVAESYTLASVGSGGATNAAVETVTARGPDAVPPVVEDETAGTGLTEARGAGVVPPVVEEGTAEGSGLSAKMKERRTKAARDQAPPNNPEARAGEAPSTEAVLQAGDAPESRRPPPSTLSFTELHTALSEVHVVGLPLLAVQSPQSPRVDLG